MTHSEYSANKRGLNIFFGAILGVVMTGAENLSALEFGVLLMVSGGFVVNLLYIGESPHRLLYTLQAAAALGLGWYIAYSDTPFFNIDREWMALRLLPAFTVWFLMVALVEFAPRENP